MTGIKGRQRDPTKQNSKHNHGKTDKTNTINYNSRNFPKIRKKTKYKHYIFDYRKTNTGISTQNLIKLQWFKKQNSRNMLWSSWQKDQVTYKGKSKVTIRLYER